jgi:hypothetical protein
MSVTERGGDHGQADTLGIGCSLPALRAVEGLEANGWGVIPPQVISLWLCFP